MILEKFLYVLCALALLVLSVSDFKTYEIPAGCNLLIGILGIFRLSLDLTHWYRYVAGFFAVSGLLFAVYLITRGKAIGGGDIKLMAAAGLFLGWKNILLALAIGSVVALGICAVYLACKKRGVLLHSDLICRRGFFAPCFGEKKSGRQDPFSCRYRYKEYYFSQIDIKF